MFDGNSKTESNSKNLPFGVFSILFVSTVLIWQWFFVEEDLCAPLKERLNHQGAYFLNWRDPELVLLTADKRQLVVTADSHMKACGLLLEKLKAEN